MALIKSGTPAREQLDKLDFDAYVLSPFDDTVVNAALQKSLDDKSAV